MESLSREIKEICYKLDTDMFLTEGERDILLSKVKMLTDKRKKAEEILNRRPPE